MTIDIVTDLHKRLTFKKCVMDAHFYRDLVREYKRVLMEMGIEIPEEMMKGIRHIEGYIEANEIEEML